MEYALRQGERPNEIVLKLTGATPVYVRVVDSHEAPIAGATVAVSFLRTQANRTKIEPLGWEAARVRTSAEGLAVFDWLPAGAKNYIGLAASAKGNRDSAFTSIPAGTTHIDIKIPTSDAVEVWGRVRLPDGRPAAGIKLLAHSVSGPAETRTEADGTYRIEATPQDYVTIEVVDDRWTAALVQVPHGQDGEGVDFSVAAAKIIRGTITSGNDSRPTRHHQLELSRAGGQRVEYLKPKTLAMPMPPKLALIWNMRTDERGQYSFRVPAGSYELSLGKGFRPQALVTGDGSEVVFDMHFDRMPTRDRKRFATVTVVDASGAKMAGATVVGECLNPLLEFSNSPPRRTNEDGEFAFDPAYLPLMVRAQTRDHRQVGFLRIDAPDQDMQVQVAPGPSVRGRLLDAAGRPLERAWINYQLVMPGEAAGDKPRLVFHLHTQTYEQGAFTLQHLVVGKQYQLNYAPNGNAELLVPLTSFKVESEADPKSKIELGDLRIPAQVEQDSDS